MDRFQKWVFASVIAVLAVIAIGLSALLGLIVYENQKHPAMTVDPSPACHLVKP